MTDKDAAAINPQHPTPPAPARPASRKTLTHCPETGKSLEGIDIRGHVNHLWPENTPNTHMSLLARERRDAMLAEAAAREAEGKGYIRR